MNAILGWLENILAPMLPAEIYSKLDFLYNAAVICLGTGIILMLAAVMFMIFAVHRSKKRALDA